jgi:hypothetical protein
VREGSFNYSPPWAYVLRVYRSADLLEAHLVLTSKSIFPVAKALHNLKLSVAQMAFARYTSGSKGSMH